MREQKMCANLIDKRNFSTASIPFEKERRERERVSRNVEEWPNDHFH
jgi:hypothetical protein